MDLFFLTANIMMKNDENIGLQLANVTWTIAEKNVWKSERKTMERGQKRGVDKTNMATHQVGGSTKIGT